MLIAGEREGERGVKLNGMYLCFLLVIGFECLL